VVVGKGKGKAPKDMSLNGLLSRYLVFRQTAHGGDMSEKQAQEDVARVTHVHFSVLRRVNVVLTSRIPFQVNKIGKSVVSDKKATIMDCFGDADAVWCRFFKPNREANEGKKGKAGTTLKVYSRSLEMFLDWVLNYQIENLTVEETVNIEAACHALNSLLLNQHFYFSG
jgi:hypothetical protein